MRFRITFLTLVLLAATSFIFPATTTSTLQPRMEAHFQVILKNFTVNRQTADDVLELDGAGDEVFNYVHTFTITIGPPARITDRLILPSPVMGDVHRHATVLAGTAAGAQGGLRTGDSFPPADSYGALHPVEVATRSNQRVSGEVPGVVFDGILIQRENAAVIFDTLWEWDNVSSPLENAYIGMFDAKNLTKAVSQIIANPNVRAPLSKSGSELGLGLPVTLGNGPFGLGEVNTRPIGMTCCNAEGRYVFDPHALILTYDGAMEAVRAGHPIRIQYVDDDRLQGDYSLFFLVVLMPR